mmetsp:Transcript_71079/g.197443  ORF Transcript_71079/g.197443 Transcript_71079/m.197443 type:complete len:336 (-) Transcript_71079:151-1158(-)
MIFLAIQSQLSMISFDDNATWVKQVVMPWFEKRVDVDLSVWAKVVEPREFNLVSSVQDPDPDAHAELHGQRGECESLRVAAHRIYDVGAEVLDAVKRGYESRDHILVGEAVQRLFVRVLDEKVTDESSACTNEGLVHHVVLGHPMLQLFAASPGQQASHQFRMVQILDGRLVTDLPEGVHDVPHAVVLPPREEGLQGPERDGAVIAVPVATHRPPELVGLREEPGLTQLSRVVGALLLERFDDPKAADVWHVRIAWVPRNGEDLVGAMWAAAWTCFLVRLPKTGWIARASRCFVAGVAVDLGLVRFGLGWSAGKVAVRSHDVRHRVYTEPVPQAH